MTGAAADATSAAVRRAVDAVAARAPATDDTDPLAAIQRRAADLQDRIDATDDEATARPLADEMGRLLDQLENVRTLPRQQDAEDERDEQLRRWNDDRDRERADDGPGRRC